MEIFLLIGEYLKKDYYLVSISSTFHAHIFFTKVHSKPNSKQ